MENKLKSLQDNYKELRSIFTNIGLGDTLDQWKEWIRDLKRDAKFWKKSSKAHEGWASTLSRNLQAMENQRATLENDLKNSQAKN